MSTSDLERRLSRIMIHLGFGDCASAVYSFLIFKNTPASIEEISSSTGYSPTAVSLGLSDLEQAGLVMREKRSRRYLYTANEHFIEEFERNVEQLLERELRPFRRALEGRIETVRESARERVQRLLESVRDAEKKLRTYISNLKRPEYSKGGK